MARNNQRGRNNNNPEGRNQYSGWMDTAKDRPMTAALGAAAAVGAGVFLWSRRNQISDQISNLSEQIGDWRDGFASDSETTGSDNFVARSNRGGRKSQSEFAEEALTLKETGKKGKPRADSVVDQQTKAGAVAY